MAATKSRRLAWVMKALNNQAKGGREGRFAVDRNLLSLQQCQVSLGEEVRSIDINLTRKYTDDFYGLRKFLYEEIPGIKFKNPHVKIVANKGLPSDPEIVVKFVDGREEKLLPTEKDSSQILNELIHMINPQSTTENIENNTQEEQDIMESSQTQEQMKKNPENFESSGEILDKTFDKVNVDSEELENNQAEQEEKQKN